MQRKLHVTLLRYLPMPQRDRGRSAEALRRGRLTAAAVHSGDFAVRDRNPSAALQPWHVAP
jgi:hypothetical protein